MRAGEGNVDERAPFRALGLAQKLHAGFVRQAITLAAVARNARAHDVFPRRLAAPIPREDVIEIQIAPVEDFSAILQVFLSRSKTLWRVNLTSFLGSRSK